MPGTTIPPRRGLAGLALLFLGLAAALPADPLSKRAEIDFSRDVASRNLRGLAARSDGRLVAGPFFADLAGTAPAELMWCLEPAGPGRWLVGTGPDGGVFELALSADGSGYSSRPVARLDEPQVFALRRLPDGSLLAGTSPRGALELVRDGKIAARTALPVDSIFDLALLGDAALVATGNPGRIYRVALARFAAAGVGGDKVSDPAALAARGITLFGEVRDRNVRRLALMPDGRVAAGSAPKGNVYLFPAPGPGAGPAAPVLLQENHDAEVTDLLPQPDGGLYAAVVLGGGDTRAPAKNRDDAGSALPPPPPAEKFSGRSWLEWFPPDGFPEILLSRSGAAFYRLARHGDLLLAAGGEQGEFSGYDLASRHSLVFPGSSSARLMDLAPVPGAPGRFLLLRDNAPGLALADFGGGGPREARTDPIDLGSPGRIGALRFERVRDLADRQVEAALRVSNGSDELEGWGPWTDLKPSDGGWRADGLRGRYAELRLRLAADAGPGAELDRAELYFLPRNRRPLVQDFHLLPPNFQITPPADSPAPAATTLGQLLQGRDDDKRKSALMGSAVAPAPGIQAAVWSVLDPDGDNVLSTFSIRRDGDPAWTDLSVASRDTWVQFDTSHLPEGTYFTRVVATEAAPRPEAERLSATYETDTLVVDHTPPEILEATARRQGDAVVVSVRGRDALSLLDSVEVTFNNGAHETVEQPADGIRDGREKTFVLQEPLARAAGATSVEVVLYDAAGNASARRLTW